MGDMTSGEYPEWQAATVCVETAIARSCGSTLSLVAEILELTLLLRLPPNKVVTVRLIYPLSFQASLVAAITLAARKLDFAISLPSKLLLVQTIYYEKMRFY